MRGPLRRWWRRVGVWWIVFAIIWILANAVANALEYYYRNYGPTSSAPPVPWLVDLVTDSAIFIIPAIAATWLLLATRIASSYYRLMSESGIQIDSPRLALGLYQLMVKNSWLFLLLAVIYHVYHSSAVYFVNADYMGLVPGFICDLLVQGLAQALRQYGYIIWLAGLLVVAPSRRFLAWLWLLAMYSLWFNWAADSLVRKFHFNYEVFARADSLIIRNPFYRVALDLVGLTAVSCCLVLLARRRTAGYMLGIAIGLVSLGGSWGVGFRSLDGAWHQVKLAVNTGLAGLYATEPWHSLVWTRPSGSSQYAFDLSILGFQLPIALGQWLYWLVLPLQAAILAGYYFLIRWLIARPRTTEGAGGM